MIKMGRIQGYGGRVLGWTVHNASTGGPASSLGTETGCGLQVLVAGPTYPLCTALRVQRVDKLATLLPLSKTFMTAFLGIGGQDRAQLIIVTKIKTGTQYAVNKNEETQLNCQHWRRHEQETSKTGS